MIVINKAGLILCLFVYLYGRFIDVRLFSHCIENDDAHYLREKVKFIIFDNFQTGSDGKSILDILKNELGMPKENIYFLDDNIVEYSQDTLLLPILLRHVSESDNNFDWFFILNSNTRFDHVLLNQMLYKMNREQVQYEKLQNIGNNINIKSPNNNYIGAKINDDTPSIVHHYNLDKNFKYPFIHSGYLIRKYAIESLSVSINSKNSTNRYKSKIFTDVHYELSRFLNDEIDINLKDVPEFCITLSDTNPKYHKKNSVIPKKCITWSISQRISHNCVSFSLPIYEYKKKSLNIVDPEAVVIAVKTTKDHHHTRVKQICKLWADSNIYLNYDSIYSNKYCNDYANSVKTVIDRYKGKNINLEFLSDYGENINGEIDIIDLNVENQTSGHCSKLYSIVHYLYKKYYSSVPNIEYYVIVDDDTLLVPFSFLNSLNYVQNYYFDNNNSGKYDRNSYLYMGLRYSLGSITENWSIDYITGGGGIVINSRALHKLVSCNECICNSPNEPDDMALGRWFRYLNVRATNFFGFNQAEPSNYHSYYNYYSHITSFHKLGTTSNEISQKYKQFFELLYPHINIDTSNKHEEL